MSTQLSASSLIISSSSSLPTSNATTITMSTYTSVSSATTYDLANVSLSSGVWLIYAKVYVYMSAPNSIQFGAYIGTDSAGGNGVNASGVEWIHPGTFTNGGIQQATFTFTRILVPSSTTTYYIRFRISNLTSGTVHINTSNGALTNSTLVPEAYAVRLA